jgi:hypothetical protein
VVELRYHSTAYFAESFHLAREDPPRLSVLEFFLRYPISRSACSSFSAAFARHSAAVMAGSKQTRRVLSEQNRTPCLFNPPLLGLVFEHDHKPRAAPKLNIVPTDKALGSVDRL